MFYVIQVEHDMDDGKYHFEVGVVWGDTRREAYEKAQNLFSAYNVFKFKMSPLELDTIRVTATKGGMIVASFEDFVGI